MPNSASSSIPALPRWQHLITPDWLAALTAGMAVPAAPAGVWRLLEVGCNGLDDYLSGHIAGAAYLDTNLLETAPLWNKVADADLLAALLAAGIDHATCVLLYGRTPLAAARAAHLMLYAGVADVRLLDGGLAAWCGAGLPLCQAAATPAPRLRHFGAPFPGRPDYLIGLDAAQALLARPDAALVSVRSWAEFSGKTSGYQYIAAKGDIAGARWGRAGADGDVNSMSAYQDQFGRMRPAQDIAAFWREAGIVATQPAAFYCGTGWRASLAFFYAWLMGWEHISVYDGGWFEWSADTANPVATAAQDVA